MDKAQINSSKYILLFISMYLVVLLRNRFQQDDDMPIKK